MAEATLLMATSNLQYEPHIDGLRALAVLSVVLFHFDFPGVTGGFVGVDIFFVISGFLITRIIINESANGNFSFFRFYIRRIRRVFPALIVMIIVVFLVSVFLFPPQEIRRIGGSVVHAVVGISNFYFWQESGYFDTESALKPLLHTWSLGVEEQFYLCWAILLTYVFTSHGRPKALPVVAITSIASLVASILFLKFNIAADNKLASDNSTIFYLLPFRLFEFGIGAMLVWLPARSPTKRSAFTDELTSLGGFLLILYPVLFFTESTAFPSYNALFPCAGAALLIMSARNTTIGRLINNRLAIRIGLISYSVYLIHWPVFVFYGYYLNHSFTIADKILLLVATLLLSYLSYTHIENRFRRPAAGSQNVGKPMLKFAVLSVTTMAIGAHAWTNNGWTTPSSNLKPTGILTQDKWDSYTVEDQLAFQKKEFHGYVWRRLLDLAKPFSNLAKKNILIIGDSMAGDFTNTLFESSLHNSDTIEIRTHPVHNGCKALIKTSTDIEYPSEMNAERCFNQYLGIETSVNFRDADTIILASDWTYWSLKSLYETVDFIGQATNAKVVVVGIKHSETAGLHAYSDRTLRKRNQLKIDRETLKLNISIAASLSRDATFIRLTDYFCAETSCPLVTREGYVIFYDKKHLSPKGAQFVGGLMAEKISWMK